MLSWLTLLCNITWRLGTEPLDWAIRVVVPIFTFLRMGTGRCAPTIEGSHSSPSLVYARVLEGWIWQMIEPQIQKEQFSFHTEHGKLDQLCTLTRVLEGPSKYAQLVHMCFVDLEKIPPHPSCYSVDGALGVWGRRQFVKGCPVPV